MGSQQSNPSNQGSAGGAHYAGGVGMRARDALKNVIAGMDKESPERHQRQRARKSSQQQTSTRVQQDRTIDSKKNKNEQNQGQDRDDPSFIGSGLIETPNQAVVEDRGYVQLNTPTTIVQDSDDADLDSGKWERKDVTSLQHSPGLNKLGSVSKFPDLIFNGYSVEHLKSLTAAERRQKRKTRKLMRMTRMTRVKDQEENLLSEKAGEHNISSVDDNLTVTEQDKQISIQLKSQKPASSNIDSLAYQTMGAGNQFPPRPIEDPEVESAQTGKHHANLGRSQIQGEQHGWQPYQTQTMTFEPCDAERAPNGDLYVLADPIVTINSDDRPHNKYQQILATSSIEEPVIKPIEPPPPKQPWMPVSPSRSVYEQNQKKRASKNTTPYAKDQTLTSKQQSTSKSPNKRQLQLLLQQTAQVSKISKGQDKPTTPKRAQAVKSSSPPTSKGRTSQHEVSKSGLHKPINLAWRKAETPRKSQASPHMQSPGKMSGNWQNSSQDRILISSKDERRSGSKQAPPLQAGIKRFKTQTREGDGIPMLPLYPMAEKGPLEDGLETSSFAEDLSYNQAKVDVMAFDAPSAGGKVPRKAPNLALLHNLSMNDEVAKISEAGLKELSIVESDNSAHAHGLETPAAALKRVPRAGGFREMLRQQKNSQDKASGTPASRREKIASGGEDSGRLIRGKSKTQIQVQEIDENSKDSRNMTPLSPSFYQKGASVQPVMISETSESKKKESTINEQQQETMKKKVNYLSSNDSAILAQSRKTSPIITASNEQTLQSNNMDRIQRQLYYNNNYAESMNKYAGKMGNRARDSSQEDMRQVRKQNSAAQRDETFNSKRLSNNVKLPFKRSNTKDERSKKQPYMHADKQPSISGFSNKMLHQKQSKKRVAKNMPIQENRRAKQNQVKQSNHFVDSDFYDTSSIHRTPHHQRASQFKRRLGSNSPSSSKGSIFIKHPSICTRVSQGGQVASDQPKATTQEGIHIPTPSMLEESDHQNKHQKMLASAAKQETQARKHINSLERELTKQQQKTEFMLWQNQKRSMGRQYQKKFLERRDKQVQIINRQIILDQEQNLNDQDIVKMGYAMSSRYDSSHKKDITSQHINNNLNDQLKPVQRSSTMKKQAGLETLRKVHDSLGIQNISTKDRSSLKKKTVGAQPNGFLSRNNNKVQQSADYRLSRQQPMTDYQQSMHSSVDQKNGAMNIFTNQVDHESTTRLRDHSNISNEVNQPMDQGIGDKQQQADYMAERGGELKLTSDESSLRQNNYEYIQEQQQANAQPQTLARSSPLQLHKQPYTVVNQKDLKQFKVPKLRVPQSYQKVVERKYNMLQTEDDTYFIPGRASRSIYKTNPHNPTVGIVSMGYSRGARQTSTKKQKGGKQVMTDDNEHSASPHEADNNETSNERQQTPGQQQISGRKKSHELHSVRNQYATYEDKIRKLTNYPAAEKMKKQREKQLNVGGTGRDDPNNLLGYMKLKTKEPTIMRNQQNQGALTSTAARRRGQLGPLKDVQGLSEEKKAMAPEMPSKMQKNIYEMLSNLNRTKTMRIANQVLQEQQQHFVAMQERRDQVCSQEAQETDKVLPAGYLGQSTQNRPNLQIQTMPSIPVTYSNSSSVFSNEYKQTFKNAYLAASLPLAQGGGPNPQQASIVSSSAAINSSTELPSKKFYGSAKKSNDFAKPPTPLADTGLRIVQKNHTSSAQKQLC